MATAGSTLLESSTSARLGPVRFIRACSTPGTLSTRRHWWASGLCRVPRGDSGSEPSSPRRTQGMVRRRLRSERRRRAGDPAPAHRFGETLARTQVKTTESALSDGALNATHGRRVAASLALAAIVLDG